MAGTTNKRKQTINPLSFIGGDPREKDKIERKAVADKQRQACDSFLAMFSPGDKKEDYSYHIPFDGFLERVGPGRYIKVETAAGNYTGKLYTLGADFIILLQYEDKWEEKYSPVMIRHEAITAITVT